MELYDTDKLFIGYSGVVYYDWGYELKKEELVITRLGTYDSDLYFNIFSDKKYKIFSETRVTSGVHCILNPITLTSFISKKYINNKKLQNLSIIKKILNGESLNKLELKKLIIALNSKNLYKTLSNITEETVDKKKSNIKINHITTLTDKKYKLNPTTGRDNEIKQILTSLAQNRKATILIGKRGVGKTSLVDEISYKISKNDVPNFLKKQEIIELNLNALLIDSNYIEEKMMTIIETAIKDNLIIFIENIDSISDYNILKLIKHAIERNDLKVIATINSENNNKNFYDDIFNKIVINEPNDETLSLIISKAFNDYSKINNIKLIDDLDELIKILKNLTKMENRILINSSNKPINYEMHNPGLIIEIIDKIFASAKVDNNKELKIENIIYGISTCDKIKKEAIHKTINYLNSTYKDTKTKSLTSYYKTSIFLRKNRPIG